MAKGIEIRNVDKVCAELDALVRDSRIALASTLDTRSDKALEEVKEATPERSGATRDMWRKDSAIAGPICRYVITHPFNTPGAVHPDTKQVANDGSHNLLADLEFGTRAHTIEAKPGKMLAFIGSWQHGMIFRQRVNHPGTRAYGMTRKAHARLSANAPDGVRASLNKVIIAHNRKGARVAA